VENREREAQDKLAATQQKQDDLRTDKARLEAQNSELTGTWLVVVMLSLFENTDRYRTWGLMCAEKLMALQNELQRTKVLAGAEADKGACHPCCDIALLADFSLCARARVCAWMYAVSHMLWHE
jgi:hypothetical protein